VGADDSDLRLEGLTDWARLFGTEFISRDRCWETCGGGYCCKPFRIQQHFAFLRREGVELPLLPGEYHFLRRGGLLQTGFEDAMSRHEIRLPNGLSFPIYRTVCRLDGICSDHSHRPMVCRIYPMAPVPDLDGRLERLEPTALIDLHWTRLVQGKNPCTITTLTPEELDRYHELSAELFRDPVNIFYLKAASLYKTAIREGLETRYPQLLELPEADFFRAWERLLVMGKLYRTQDVLAQLVDLSDALSARWGDAFSLEGL